MYPDDDAPISKRYDPIDPDQKGDNDELDIFTVIALILGFALGLPVIGTLTWFLLTR